MGCPEITAYCIVVGSSPLRPANFHTALNSTVEVAINGVAAEVLYAGGYPGSVDRYQVNFKARPGAKPIALSPQVGDKSLPCIFPEAECDCRRSLHRFFGSLSNSVEFPASATNAHGRGLHPWCPQPIRRSILLPFVVPSRVKLTRNNANRRAGG